MTREVWITGIGLTSSLGDGLDAHWQAMTAAGQPKISTDLSFTPPFAIHPLVDIDLNVQIPRRADQRQMEAWQRLGTYAAGLALGDAGIAGNPDILDQTHLIVAADGGERDVEADSGIIEGMGSAAEPALFLNEHLANDLRPTLFLAQLPNLLAGNISIVHQVTGSSRTFMGEEIAGASAAEVASRRIAAGQGDIFLIGGAHNASRKDIILNSALGGILWTGEPVPVWERVDRGGGLVFGAAGAFLVLEAREHAEARGATPYARLGPIRTDQSRRRPGDVAATLARQIDEIKPAGDVAPALMSGATGILPATQEERELLRQLLDTNRLSAVRAAASLLGATSSATMTALVGLAALAIARRGFYSALDSTGLEKPLDVPPDDILVTVAGRWRGESAGLVSAV
ncbi:MAG: beta-ketoacyl-ACP synthase [Alphaproteobacteria bacterium]